MPTINISLAESTIATEQININALYKDIELDTVVVNDALDTTNTDLDIDNKGFLEAKKEFEEFLTIVETNFNKLKNKQLINGTIIKSISVKEESGIDLEIETIKNTPKGISLGSKSDLLALIDDTIELLESVEDISKSYTAINDSIMKSNEAIDKIIREIDGINIESLGKYKTVISTKVRERLKLMKTFFNNYNKINKNLFTMVIETSEANAAYAVTSLKYFG